MGRAEEPWRLAVKDGAVEPGHRRADLDPSREAPRRSDVVEHRAEYEQALNETIALTEEFADRLPQFTHHLDGQLRDEEQSFDDLGRSIDEVSAALPAYARTASRLVQATRLLLGLVAAVVALHGLYLIGSSRTKHPERVG